jgi:hypothetical protein
MDDDDDLGVSSRPRSKSKASVAFIDTQLQASFMPNASPHRDRRRYLTWNSVGLLVVRYDDSNTSHLEVEYADQGRFRNVLYVNSVGGRSSTLVVSIGSNATL